MIKESTWGSSEDLTGDGGVVKKILKKGFSMYGPKEGDEVKINYISQLEDGRIVDNTRITNQPQVVILGKNSIIPGLEMALKYMKMGEEAKIIIQPKYSNSANEELEEGYNTKELSKLDVEIAKKYSPIIYELELIKFDKPRKNKLALEPDERITEAATLKIEGNDLFKEKRHVEAIIKYNDGLDYLTQLPNEFITNRVIDLKLQLKLNITNCHIAMHQYVYALKKLEEVLIIQTPPPAKYFYYSCICNMNLGEFDKAEDDLDKLSLLLPNDSNVNVLKNDLIKNKEKTLKTKQDIFKKGIFRNHLYEEKNIKTANLPIYDKTNLSFYLDILVDKNTKNPKKVKFEIFSSKDKNIQHLIGLIKEEILCKYYKEKQITYESEENAFLLRQYTDSEIKALLDLVFSNNTNFFPPCEDYLLIIHRKSDGYNLKLQCCKVSDHINTDMLVLGRCYFNQNFLKELSKTQNALIEVTECDIAANL
jgi:tetratricopeptide (TPR) repeat protein